MVAFRGVSSKEQEEKTRNVGKSEEKSVPDMESFEGLAFGHKRQKRKCFVGFQTDC